MEALSLEIMPRDASGSSASRRYRRQGLLPVVVYAHGEKSVVGLLNQRDFLHIGSSARSSQVFSLKSSIKEIDGKVAVIKEVQSDYLRGKVLHVDFQALKEDEVIAVRVSLRFTGEAPGVKLENGILTIATHDLGVKCLPKAIPQEIVIDVSGLNLGNSIHAADVALPEGVKLDDNPDETIVSVVAVRTVVETPVAAAAAVETAEGGATTESAAEGETEKNEKKS